jgi:hypothetical protein
MSKHINVNPDHYKIGGRDRVGNAVAKAKERAELDKTAATRWEKRQRENTRGNQNEKVRGKK